MTLRNADLTTAAMPSSDRTKPLTMVGEQETVAVFKTEVEDTQNGELKLEVWIALERGSRQ